MHLPTKVNSLFVSTDLAIKHNHDSGSEEEGCGVLIHLVLIQSVSSLYKLLTGQCMSMRRCTLCSQARDYYQTGERTWYSSSLFGHIIKLG